MDQIDLESDDSENKLESYNSDLDLENVEIDVSEFRDMDENMVGKVIQISHPKSGTPILFEVTGLSSDELAKNDPVKDPTDAQYTDIDEDRGSDGMRFQGKESKHRKSKHRASSKDRASMGVLSVEGDREHQKSPLQVILYETWERRFIWIDLALFLVILNLLLLVDCQDAMSRGVMYEKISITPDAGPYFVVTCNHYYEHGGWTIIQKRANINSTVFDKSWVQYRYGFHSEKGDYWLGSEYIHRLTYNRHQSLRILLTSRQGNMTVEYIATYKKFYIDGEFNSFTIHIDNFEGGNAGDRLSGIDGTPFSTADKDHDQMKNRNCAIAMGTGWWFNKCNVTALNMGGGKEFNWEISTNDSAVKIDTSTMMVTGPVKSIAKSD